MADLRRIYWHHHRPVVAPVSPVAPPPDTDTPDARAPDADTPDARAPDADSPDTCAPVANTPDAGAGNKKSLWGKDRLVEEESESEECWSEEVGVCVWK